MWTRHRKKNESGLGLIETVAALGVVVLVIGALVSLGITSLRASGSAKSAAIAGTLVDRELELVRIYRDNNSWVDFEKTVDDCAAPLLESCDATDSCYMDSVGAVLKGGEDEETRSGLDFIRCFNYISSDSTASKVHVIAVVEWTDFIGSHTTLAETYLTEWD